MILAKAANESTFFSDFYHRLKFWTLNINDPQTPTKDFCTPWLAILECLSPCLLSPLNVCWSGSKTSCIYRYIQGVFLPDKKILRVGSKHEDKHY